MMIVTENLHEFIIQHEINTTNKFLTFGRRLRQQRLRRVLEERGQRGSRELGLQQGGRGSLGRNTEGGWGR